MLWVPRYMWYIACIDFIQIIIQEECDGVPVHGSALGNPRPNELTVIHKVLLEIFYFLVHDWICCPFKEQRETSLSLVGCPASWIRPLCSSGSGQIAVWLLKKKENWRTSWKDLLCSYTGTVWFKHKCLPAVPLHLINSLISLYFLFN